MTYLFSYNNKETDVSLLGANGVTLGLANQGVDTLSFTVPGDFDGKELFPYLGYIKFIQKEETKNPAAPVIRRALFAGRVTGCDRQGTGTTERISYTVSGPWWDMGKYVFCQLWNMGQVVPSPPPAPGEEEGEEEEKTPDLPKFEIVQNECSKLTLGYDKDGKRINAGEIISDVVKYLRESCGMGIAIGELDVSLDTFVPTDDVEDLSCAEVISRVLRWFPGLVVLFDYSGALEAGGAVKLCIVQPESGTGKLLRMGIDGITDVSISPRYDLRPECVRIQYLIENQGVDNEGNQNSYTVEIIDKYPQNKTGRELGAVRFVINLEGNKMSGNPSQKLQVDEINFWEYTWWRKYVKKLTDERLVWITPKSSNQPLPFVITDCGIKDANGVAFGAGTEFDDWFPNETPRMIVSGGIADWMKDKKTGDEEEEKKGLRQTQAVVWAIISYAWNKKEGSGNNITYSTYKRINELVSVKVTITDAHSKKYKTDGSATAGEVPPLGLAQKFYELTRKLRFDGSLSVVAPEPFAGLSVGDVVSLAGGRKEWETMGAVIQGITMDFDNGKTALTLGFPSWLSPSDWVAFYRGNRGRKDAASSAKRRKEGKTEKELESEIPITFMESNGGNGDGSIVLHKMGKIAFRNVLAAQIADLIPFPPPQFSNSTGTTPSAPSSAGVQTSGMLAGASPLAGDVNSPVPPGEEYEEANPDELESEIMMRGNTYQDSDGEKPEGRAQMCLKPKELKEYMFFKQQTFLNGNGEYCSAYFIMSRPRNYGQSGNVTED